MNARLRKEGKNEFNSILEKIMENLRNHRY